MINEIDLELVRGPSMINVKCTEFVKEKLQSTCTLYH